MGFHKMYLGAFRNILLRIGAVVLVVLGSIIYYSLPADSYNGQCDSNGSGIRNESQNLRISNIVLCEGLNKGGNPYRQMRIGKSEDWQDLHICVEVKTSGPATISAHWAYGNGIEFAGTGVYEDVEQSGYAAISLAEAMACSDNSVFPNYLADDIAAGRLPAGQYNVRIYQGGDWIASFSFEVEN